MENTKKTTFESNEINSEQQEQVKGGLIQQQEEQIIEIPDDNTTVHIPKQFRIISRRDNLYLQ